jgi:hypothetical protein
VRRSTNSANIVAFARSSPAGGTNMTKRVAQWLGYQNARRLKDGRWIGVRPAAVGSLLLVGIEHFGHDYAYSYKEHEHALLACAAWNGELDPPGPWTKLIGHPTRGDESGPGERDDGILSVERFSAEFSAEYR